MILYPDTFAHRASTLQDIEKCQDTEIDTLNCCIPKWELVFYSIESFNEYV